MGINSSQIIFLIGVASIFTKNVLASAAPLPTSKVAAWTSELTQSSFVYEQLSIPTRLKTLDPYFTEDGYQQFINTLLQGPLAAHLKGAGKLIFKTASPLIKAEGFNQYNLYEWQITVPVEVIPETGDNPSQLLAVNLQIVYLPTAANPNQLAVNSYTITSAA